jgi:hypothetical protein
VRRGAQVGDSAGGNTGQARRDVVEQVERDRDLGRRIGRATRLEQVRGAQDQQRRRDVPDFEDPDRPKEPAELAAHDRPEPQPDRLTLSLFGSRGAADRVDDRRHGEQARNDRQQDGRANADQPDQPERKQRTDNRAQVVHRALEAVGAPVDGRWHRVAARSAPEPGGHGWPRRRRAADPPAKRSKPPRSTPTAPPCWRNRRRRWHAAAADRRRARRLPAARRPRDRPRRPRSARARSPGRPTSRSGTSAAAMSGSHAPRRPTSWPRRSRAHPA